jgi:hypothetical protein
MTLVSRQILAAVSLQICSTLVTSLLQVLRFPRCVLFACRLTDTRVLRATACSFTTFHAVCATTANSLLPVSTALPALKVLFDRLELSKVLCA